MLKSFSGFLVVVLCAANPTTAPRASAQSAEDIYERGTDIGMLYLSEHSRRLRVTLLLQECGFGELASTVGTLLPNTLQFFLENYGASGWDSTASSSAAQVSRSYVLGYETGVRTEFRREQSEERRRTTCSMAAAAAGQMLQ